MFSKIKEVNMMLGGLNPSEVLKNKIWCGVDSGTDFLLSKNIIPKIVYGDLDSITEKFDGFVRKKDDQNLTDTEFALNNVAVDFPEVEVVNLYGATGKRLDHFYGNLLLLNNETYNFKVNIIDDNNIITIFNKNENEVKFLPGYKYISILPIYEDTVVTIKYAKYEANNLLLTLNRPNATSNEFVEENNIKLISNNNCFLIYSKD